MITINGIRLPNQIMSKDEMHWSLKISPKHLEELEAQGLPYTEIETMHVYDPVKVWKWYAEYRRKK